MSVITSRTSLSSILKTYTPAEREKTKAAIMNKVRFEMPRQKGILEVVKAVEERQNFEAMNEFVAFLTENDLDDTEFISIFNDARTIVNQLSPKFTHLVEALLSQQWTNRSQETRKAYSEFCLDILVAHNKYLQFGINKLINHWIPQENDIGLWLNGEPTPELDNGLQAIHQLLERILNAIPMAFDATLDAIEHSFPYYKKATHIVVGYVHNILQLLKYKPIFGEYIIQLLMQNLVILDVHAPRAAIEELESDDEDDDEDEDNEQEMFEMDDCRKKPNSDRPMNHPIAHTLDICMMKIFNFLDLKSPQNSATQQQQQNEMERQQKTVESIKFLRLLIKAFDNVILPIHNTHHAQFMLFYFCSLKQCLGEQFLTSLWDKIKNPNCSAVIRQASVGYMASFLARSKFININILKHYLKELCSWAHKYIRDCDQYRSNGSLKANLVFFSVCQAIFYVIAFRSRDLTVDKKSLLFLQSLHLSALVTCNFNPLRVCLPAVATAFAGVTRAYQLAYCHTILERNARRKLATVYANDTATPEETLDTFFPFDPYLLKMSGQRITPIYLVYQASEAEEHVTAESMSSHHTAGGAATNSRKRGDSEMLDDHEVDDFILSDKRQRLTSFSKTHDRENQFTYGLSPGFHI
ncbi:RNA polymerase I-specific transcription initiation factor RRN3 [Musca vetustissima]|uniref:RNA polymerase I-specific transcription initiation factor RRN3 n=1 Tax=Musca vetustissima TaxID=27455 RepID=UPI002AB5E5C3|nr:RNA polymerase I-specific transcription initiation factor RRN3 [Musca vetustissima]